MATVIVGAVKTNIFVNSPEHHLPQGSIYTPAEKEIQKRAVGQDVDSRLGHRDEFAKLLVNRVLSGASGKVYVGNMSKLFRFLTSWLPDWLVVSQRPFPIYSPNSDAEFHTAGPNACP